MKHVLGFSGGIDSQATAAWLLDRYAPEDVLLINSDVGGNEHPITTQFIEEYSQAVHPVHVITPLVIDLLGQGRQAIEDLGLKDSDVLTFDLMSKIKKRFPSRKAQFCTEILKLNPMRRWLYQNGAKGLNESRRRRSGGTWRPYGEEPCVLGILSDGYERYSGVRRDESAARQGTADRWWDDGFQCWINAPIADWTKQDAFKFVEDKGQKINPLYRMGFKRVGCAPCINSGKGEIRLWAARFPEMIDKIREWEERVGNTFFHANMPDGEWGGIDRVVEWSKTSRGGLRKAETQFELPILEMAAQSDTCESVWGLCE